MRGFSSPETLLDIDFSAPVYVVVDRLAIAPDMRSRLIDSVEICYREGRGEAILEFVADAARAPAGFVQQSLRGLSSLPGFRKYRGFRYQSGDPRPRKIAQRRRDPIVDN